MDITAIITKGGIIVTNNDFEPKKLNHEHLALHAKILGLDPHQNGYIVGTNNGGDVEFMVPNQGGAKYIIHPSRVITVNQ